MASIPRDSIFDSSLALLKEGNTFIYNRCKKLNSDIFETRLLLKKTVCIQGKEAAKAFYKEGRFTRQGAIPKSVLWSLQDEGSVATLNDEAHHQRKAMFMSMMTQAAIEKLLQHTAHHWQQAIGNWKTMDKVVLLPELEKIICAAVCQWIGIKLTAEETASRSKEIGAMIDGAGSVGWRNWRGLFWRRRTEKWLQRCILKTRNGEFQPEQNSPLFIIAFFKDENGQQLDTDIAAVELLNIVRPTVAVARYILFCAFALQQYPQCRQNVCNTADYADYFVQEVRRFYPFFPFVGGIVRQPFSWQGYDFTPGLRVLLDIYGSNRDPREWDRPTCFKPERFAQRTDDSYTFIPQGGGDVLFNHRCAGEWITTALMKQAVLILTQLRYQVVTSGVELLLHRMPAVLSPEFTITHVNTIHED